VRFQQIFTELRKKFGQTVVAISENSKENSMFWLDNPSDEAHKFLLAEGYQKIEGEELEKCRRECNQKYETLFTSSYVLYKALAS